MATSKNYVVPFRRRREGKTNYKKRLAYLLSGKPRLVVRITNTQFIAQIVVSEKGQDRVIAQFNSSSLAKKYGWKYAVKNLPSAYLTGFMLGKLALSKGIKEVILDAGLRKPHRKGRIYALVKGMIDAGVHIPYDPTILPDESRLKGEHIKAYLGKDVVKEFEAIKKKIEEEFSKASSSKTSKGEKK
ncbi:MAG: 50S ribosomal protein L18 [Candidatus Nanohaloarchaeota archaeon]|nr:50S ribosomal protein L18 [Candidatus Nanohaloarchaeota archaeon]